MKLKRNFMISARMPADLVGRVDFVVRNTDNDALITRSAVIEMALLAWLPSAEKRLVELGVPPPKRK